MRTKNQKANLIILVIIVLLFLLLSVVVILLGIYKNGFSSVSNENDIIVAIDDTDDLPKTTQEIIESYGSEYLGRDDNAVTIKIYANFLYDLYDENGKSKQNYFYSMIDEIVDVEKVSFYLIDSSKNIEFLVIYDEESDSYTISVNGSETYYDDTDGKIYVELSEAGIVESSKLSITNTFILQLTLNEMNYSGTTLFPVDTRVDLGNGYYSIEDGTILGRLQSGKVLNLLFEEGYEEEIAKGITVGTSLSTIYDTYPDAAFGSVSDKYLGYRTTTEYVFFYNDEVSVYSFKYAENSDFDEYFEEYCATGDLETLYDNFKEYTTYFENEYDANTGTLRLTYPLRGLEIDIKNNDSTGIKIYNNYYLTDTVKELIKSKKITYVDKDLINETEKTRRAGN